MRLMDAKRTLPPLLARMRRMVSLSLRVAIGQYEKICLSLLLILEIAFCLLRLVHCALVSDWGIDVNCQW